MSFYCLLYVRVNYRDLIRLSIRFWVGDFKVWVMEFLICMIKIVLVLC